MNFSFYSSRGKTASCGSNLSLYGLEQKVGRNVFQLPFAIQLQPPWEPWAAFTPHTPLSSGASGESSSQLQCAVWNYILPSDLKIIWASLPLADKRVYWYEDFTFVFCSFFFRANDPWHLVQITWLSASRAMLPLPSKAFSWEMLQSLRQGCVIRGNGLRLRNPPYQHQHLPLNSSLFWAGSWQGEVGLEAGVKMAEF